MKIVPSLNKNNLNQLEVATIDDKLRMAYVTFNKEDF